MFSYFFEHEVWWLNKVGLKKLISLVAQYPQHIRSGQGIVGGTRSTAVVGKLAPSSTSLPPPWHYYQGRLQSFPTKPLPMHHHNFHSTHPSANFRQIGQYLIFLPYPLEMKYFAFIHSPSTHWQSKTCLNLSGLFLWWLQSFAEDFSWQH